MKRPLVVFPTTFEADAAFKFFGAPLKCRLGGKCKFTLANGTECEALVAGVGCEKSASRVREAAESFCPTDIILCGFAGACGDAEPGEFVFESGSADIAKMLSKKGMRAGKIAFCEAVADAAEKERLGGLGYAAVEMESELFKAATGDEDGDFKPVFTQIRCISDAAGTSIPAPLAESAMDRETGALKLSPWAALKEILRNPPAALALVKFAKAAARAKKEYDIKIPQALSSL